MNNNFGRVSYVVGANVTEHVLCHKNKSLKQLLYYLQNTRGDFRLIDVNNLSCVSQPCIVYFLGLCSQLQ